MSDLDDEKVLNQLIRQYLCQDVTNIVKALARDTLCHPLRTFPANGHLKPRQRLAIGTDSLFISFGNTVKQYDLQSGQFLKEFATTRDVEIRDIEFVESTLYLITHDEDIKMYNKDGKFISKITISRDVEPSFFDIAVDETSIYVISWLKHQIISINKHDGKITNRWGRKGNGDGQFKMINGVAVNTRYVFVLDDCCRVQKFDKQGRFIRSWKFTKAEKPECQHHMIRADNEYIYVLSADSNVLYIFDEDGNVIKVHHDDRYHFYRMAVNSDCLCLLECNPEEKSEQINVHVLSS
jgi:hypothetical protein